MDLLKNFDKVRLTEDSAAPVVFVTKTVQVTDASKV
jgi:hypothetical protein